MALYDNVSYDNVLYTHKQNDTKGQDIMSNIQFWWRYAIPHKYDYSTTK